MNIALVWICRILGIVWQKPAECPHPIQAVERDEFFWRCRDCGKGGGRWQALKRFWRS